MKELYCPDCGNYLLSGDGNKHDCCCGWKQPTESTGCDCKDAEYMYNLIVWSYNKLQHRCFSEQDDALMLDAMRLLIEHGIES